MANLREESGRDGSLWRPVLCCRGVGTFVDSTKAGFRAKTKSSAHTVDQSGSENDVICTTFYQTLHTIPREDSILVHISDVY